MTVHGTRGNSSTICALGTLCRKSQRKKWKLYTGNTTCVCGRAEETHVTVDPACTSLLFGRPYYDQTMWGSNGWDYLKRCFDNATMIMTAAGHASQSLQPLHPPHRVPTPRYRQTRDDLMTIHTTQAHKHSSRRKIHIIILQVNGIKTT